MHGANPNDWNKDSEEITWKDYFKNTIRLGDLVLYPNRAGSSLWMNHGTVVARGTDKESRPVIVVKKVQTTWDGRFAGHKEVTIYCLDRVIALGRGHGDFGYKPQKAKTEPVLKETWIDRVMSWLRS
jgi:hypothetical protein